MPTIPSTIAKLRPENAIQLDNRLVDADLVQLVFRPAVHRPGTSPKKFFIESVAPAQ